ncbi:MAG: GNAT family N-acetyltransferase, partial [Dehalococcoidales bacterium]|nr:GNAT family N-acetyltransferase [Dehalococcoidales bacterium]
MSYDEAIRGYRESDCAGLLRLRNAAAALAADGRYLTAEAQRSSLERPGYRPEENLFVIEMNGGVVGYADVIVELKLGRAIVAGYVEPVQRRHGLGGRLYQRAEARARQAGVKIVQVNVN